MNVLRGSRWIPTILTGLVWGALFAATGCEEAPEPLERPASEAAEGRQFAAAPERQAFVRVRAGSPRGARIAEAFAAAEAKYGLPPGLLEALAEAETGLRPPSPHRGESAHACGDEEEPYGIMGLRPDDHRGATLAAAAAAAGFEETTAARFDETNIEAAAALLRTWAGPLARAAVPADWFGAVEQYSGLEGAAAAKYASGISAAMLDGKRMELIDGTVIELLARELAPASRGALEPTAGTSPDYPGADYTPASTSNYTAANRTAADIDRIVIHTVQGSYAGAISWFANPAAGVSAHYVVKSSNGAITQTLLDKHIGWHAGHWTTNTISIGIEHEGFVNDASWYTEAMYKESAKLTKHLCDKYGIPKDRTHIIGHYEVPGCSNPNGGGVSCHTDPGPNWNWDKYMGYVNGTTVTPPPTTGELLGFVREGDIFSGPPIPGATVKLNTGASTTTNADGLYQFASVPPATYTVTVSKAGYVTKSDTKVVEAGIQNWKSIALEVEAPPPVQAGKLVGFIREGDIYTGPPIPGAKVTLSTGATATSGSDGLYTFESVPAGAVDVTAAKTGYITKKEAKVVEAGITNWKSMALTKETPPPPPPPEDTGVTPPEPDVQTPEEDAGSGAPDTTVAPEDVAADAPTTADVPTPEDAGPGEDSGPAPQDAGFDGGGGADSVTPGEGGDAASGEDSGASEDTADPDGGSPSSDTGEGGGEDEGGSIPGEGGSSDEGGVDPGESAEGEGSSGDDLSGFNPYGDGDSSDPAGSAGGNGNEAKGFTPSSSGCSSGPRSPFASAWLAAFAFALLWRRRRC